MKIKDLMYKNFAKVSEVSVSFDKNITYLIGTNGAGKTTIGLNGVWFIFKGLAQKGDGLIAERFRFIGPGGKSAQGVANIYDEKEGVQIKITRKLLKNKTELKIEASDGRQLDQAWLDSIFNSFLIDPVGFSKLSGKEQALAFGADTDSFDKKKKELEVERRDIGRDVKRLQGVVESAGNPEEVYAVDVMVLMKELEKRQDINTEHREANNTVLSMDENILKKQRDIKSLEYEIEELRANLDMAAGKLVDMAKERKSISDEVDKMEVADEQEIKDQVTGANAINLKARDYQELQGNKAAMENVKTDYEEMKSSVVKVIADRNKYLLSLNLPWPNITITDKGEFRLNDKPFCSPYFSTGEILKFGARIGSKLKDGLKYVYFPCSNNLDDENREAIFRALIEEGFQIVAEYVGTKRKKDTSILLKEMKVVESYDNSEGDGLK